MSQDGWDRLWRMECEVCTFNDNSTGRDSKGLQKNDMRRMKDEGRDSKRSQKNDKNKGRGTRNM